MSGRRISKRYSLVFFLVFSLVFSPINLSFFANSSSAEAADLMIETDTEWSGVQTISGYASVISGVTLTIKKGAVIEFEGQSTLDVAGSLVVEGTPSEPIVFRKKNSDNPDDYYTIVSSGNIYARNIDVSGGGSISEVFMVEKNRRRSLFQHVNAFWMYSGAFGAQGGGTLDIEGANFHDNVLAVYADQNSYDKTKVWRSKFSGNTYDFVNQYNSTQSGSDVRYNWWGDTNGPAVCTLECGEYYPRPYQKIIGKANFSDWAREGNFKDPVVVIPGIMGSWKMTQKSELELDSIFGTYDELLETLDENGYTLGTSLFPFPYEWHYSNIESAKLLKTKIDEIKAQAKWPRVDIVAHSMGGLVAREYIGALNGGSNIDQLITLGTPHNGSSESYLAWEGGSFRGFRGFFANKIFQQEAEENDYASIFEYIRKAPIASVKELLPVYSYLRDKESDVLRTYPSLYPTNTFLQNLKTATNINRLTPVAFTNIVGKMNDSDTIEKIRVDGASIELLNDPEAIVLWGHGKPDGYDDLLGGDRGLELGFGDGTVPIDSAKSITADETIEIESSHSDLPSAAAKTAFRILTGSDVVSTVPSLSIPTSLLLFMPFSPVDVQIVSPSQKRVGKNFHPENGEGEYYNEIPGAYYTGFDTQNEFVTIPNPEKGEYRILTQGTGAGDYRIEAVSIQEDASGQAKESVATFTGIAETGKEDENTVEVDETGAVVVADDRDTLAPATMAAPSGTMGTNAWYIGDVAVTLTAIDNEGGSGVEKTEYSLDNGATWGDYASPFSLDQEGTNIIQYFSTDKEGNKEEIKTATVKIDKTAPETKITFNPTTQKLDIIGTDNLLQAVSVVIVEKPEMNVSSKKVKKIKPWFSRWFQKNRKNLPDMLATLTDEAGHMTSIAFEKTKDKDKRLFLGIKSIAYDESEPLSLNGAVQYKWQIDRKNQYRLFAAHLRTALADIESHYIPKKNETWIMERPRELADDDNDDESEHRPIRTRLSGMVIPYLETENGSVKIGY
ncbi:MAG: hypothetical protein Q8Q10_00435 [bacterium]|nr:hypothetical protein [bacterium]